MIRHILKMVWNRKRANALVATEICISFIVLFGVVALAVYSISNYRQPLGYSYDDVWTVHVENSLASDNASGTEQLEDTRLLLQTLRELPEIERVAGAFTTPYSNSRSVSGYEIHGRVIQFDRNNVTDDFKDVMKLHLIAGRWFSAEDQGTGRVSVVINARLARQVFGDVASAVGKNLYDKGPDNPEERVIGVIDDYRGRGEYAGPLSYAFYRLNLDGPDAIAPGEFVLRLRPGTPRAFEETLGRRLESVGKTYSFRILPLAESRQSALMMMRAPILAVGLIAGFLMIMVALGLTGVLWQNVTQRTREIGLRRAKGATQGDVTAQILGEQVVITTLGVLVGSALAIQVPLLAPLDSVSPWVYVWGFVISLLAMYALTTLCGLYPSRLAARVKPAEALHYD